MGKTAFFQKPLGEDEQIIAEMSPGNFDGLVKLIVIIQKITGMKALSIVGSKFVQSFDYIRCWLSIDLGSLFDKAIDMSFIGDAKALNKIKGNSDVIIIRNSSSYRISNGQYEAIYGVHNNGKKNIVPEITSGEQLGVEIVLEDELKTLRNFCHRSKYIDLMLTDNQLSELYFPNRKRYAFNTNPLDQFREPNRMLLRSYRLLSVPGERMEIRLYRYHGDFWMVTKTSITMELETVLFEKLGFINNK